MIRLIYRVVRESEVHDIRKKQKAKLRYIPRGKKSSHHTPTSIKSENISLSKVQWSRDKLNSSALAELAIIVIAWRKKTRENTFVTGQHIKQNEYTQLLKMSNGILSDSERLCTHYSLCGKKNNFPVFHCIGSHCLFLIHEHNLLFRQFFFHFLVYIFKAIHTRISR